ncbi:MAG TPA: DALR anticodon-binding domain-containing protein, partial [Thermoanaerobaculia bacterium]
QAVRNDASFLAVVLAAKRIANITKDQPAHELDAAALALPAERALSEASRTFSASLEDALARRDFAAGLAAVGQLAPSLEVFFNEVLVMDPDPANRANRLALLQQIAEEIGRLADLSRLVVDKAELRTAT